MSRRRVVLMALLVLGCEPTAAAPSDASGVAAPDAGHVRRDAGVDAATYDPPDAFAPDAFVRMDAGPGRLEMALGPTVVAARPPPPLSGGSLLLTHDARFAVVSDPDRDRIVVVELATRDVQVIPLSLGDEPGRSVEDASGHVHVALRRGGAVVAIDPGTHTLLGRRDVCPAPRGIAYEAAGDRLHVACAGGELVTLPTTLAPPTRTLHLDDDLRDVVVVGSDLFVSRFRAAQVLVVDGATGVLRAQIGLPGIPALQTTASVAWRMIPSPDAGVIVVHQQGRYGTVDAIPGGYGSGCSSVVRAAIVEIPSATAELREPTMLPGCAVLPVDADTSGSGNLIVVAAGAAPLGASAQLFGIRRDPATHAFFTSGGPVPRGMDAMGRIVAIALSGTGTAPETGATSGTGTAVTQVREPAALWIALPGDTAPTYLPLGGDSVADTGFELFHSNVGAGLACASCHPEGGDDGRVWSFDVGMRRTMALRGGLVGTEPFHWAGELPDFASLVDDVFVGRMSGGSLSPEHIDALEHWIDATPLLPRESRADASSVARGRVLFESTQVGCADCHSGPRLSTQATVDVGTDGFFQVPSLLGIAARAPYMHDGCAATLRDRFRSPCGGGDMHGHTSALTPAQLDDLVAYLETL